MKKIFSLFICGFLGTFLILGQNELPKNDSESWGDYYFVNQEYQKSIDFYSTSESTKDLHSIRNWAVALSMLNRGEEAKKQYEQVANSSEARVEDYYNFADLLFDENQLAAEYRNKAFLLPWPTPALFDNDSLLYKKRFNQNSYEINSVDGNTERSEFGLVFLTEGAQSSVFYLSEQDKTKASAKVLKRIKTDYPVYNFHKAIFDKASFAFTAQEELRSQINSLFQEGPASYYPESDVLYFTRSANQLDKKKTLQLNLYRIKLSDVKEAITPIPLSVNVEGFSSVHPSISPSGKYLYFASDRPGGFGGMDLYRSEIVDGVLSYAINLGADINTTGDEVFPFAYDDRFVFYSSNGKEGLGKMDVYLAENRIEKRWETYLLGAGINSTEDDFSFGLNQNLELGYFASSRENGKGADDLYAFDFKPKIEGVRDVYEYVPTDTLVVAMNHVLYNDKLNLEQQDPLQRLVKKEVELTAATLYGDLRLNANGSFYYKNTQPTQAKDSFAYRLKTVKGVSEDVWVNLNRSSVDKELLNPELTDAFLPILFNLDDSSILEVYKDRADKVISVMNQNPTLEVELSSFTDCRGSLDYNLALSERRTNEIIGYVQERISSPNRIYGKGYGEDVSDSEFTRNFALVAGSFEDPKNMEAMVSQLRDQGYDPILSNHESKVRVLVSQYDSRESVDRAKSQLIADGLDVWVLINPCNLISEEEHQLKRRTNFKVIRL